MNSKKWIFMGFVVLLVFGLTISTGCGKKQGGEETEKLEVEKPEPLTPDKELPAAVIEAIETHVPDAEIDKVEVDEEAGITLYDIEFKGDRGEIELAADGTVIDVVTIVMIEELPEAASKAIQDAIGDAKILRLEKSEIYSEIDTEGEKGTIVKLEVHKFVYEAELEMDGQTGEIEVDADGNITEPLKWDQKEV